MNEKEYSMLDFLKNWIKDYPYLAVLLCFGIFIFGRKIKNEGNEFRQSKQLTGKGGTNVADGKQTTVHQTSNSGSGSAINLNIGDISRGERLINKKKYQRKCRKTKGKKIKK